MFFKIFNKTFSYKPNINTFTYFSTTSKKNVKFTSVPLDKTKELETKFLSLQTTSNDIDDNVVNQSTMPMNALRFTKSNFFRYYYYKRSSLNFRFYKYNTRFYFFTLLLKPRLYYLAAKKLQFTTLPYDLNVSFFNFFHELNTEMPPYIFFKRKELNNYLNIFFKTLKSNKLQFKFLKTELLELMPLLKEYKYNIKHIVKFKKLIKRFKKLSIKYNVKKLHYNKRLHHLILSTTLQTYFMKYVKFYNTRNIYYKFRHFKLAYRFKKRIKWIYKRRVKLAKKRKIFIKGRSYKFRKRRYSYRLRKMLRPYSYKRFSYFWLRYFFHRFTTMYIEENKTFGNYKIIKNYLHFWLYKVRKFNFLSLYSLNKARGFLLKKSVHLFSKYKKYRLFNYHLLSFFADRNDLDDMLRFDVRKKRFKYKNFYWRYYKSTVERRKLNVLRKDYRYQWNFYPYIFIRKRYKMFYNWADRHIYKRFPYYRYKYTVTYKFPRYANYRNLFKNQLREQHVFRYLYRLKLGQLIKAFRKSIAHTKRSFELMFFKYFELRLDTVVYRLNFAYSLKHARQLVLRGLFLVNNKVIDNPKYHVVLGDIIMPIKRLRMQPLSKKALNYVDYGVTLTWTRLFYRPIQSDQYPSHFLINERIPAAMIMTNLNPYKVRHSKPFSVQFLTLSLLKYN